MFTMSQEPAISPLRKTREQSAGEINRAMARFPLILQILGELGHSPLPLPGDDDIRHGCERSLTTILSELAHIRPAPAGQPSRSEETAQSWLQIPAVRKHIDADKLERMQQVIDAILSPPPETD
jgi:hypothetical protein